MTKPKNMCNLFSVQVALDIVGSISIHQIHQSLKKILYIWGRFGRTDHYVFIGYSF